MSETIDVPEEYYAQLMQQYGNRGGGVPSGEVYNDRADLLEKIKPEHMVEIIRHRLAGREYSEGKWINVEHLKEKKLSERGAYEIANLMLSVSSINISISKFNDREIKERLRRIAKTAQRMLLRNWRAYDITETSQFYYVHEIVFTNTMGVLKQADNASIQDLLKGTVSGRIGEYQAPYKEGITRKIGRMIGVVR